MALLIVFILVVVMFSSGGGSSASLLAIAQRQGNIAKVAELALQDTDSQAVKNVAINAQLAAQSDQKSLTALAGQFGISFSEKDLELGINPEVQSQFETAKAAGLLNQTALETLAAEIQAYQVVLAAGFEQTGSEELKQLLAEQHEATELLAIQIQNTQP